MKIFIYFILILSFVNIIIFSNVNALGITEYETITLFKDDGYEYKITYPVSEDNEWSIFYGATDATIYKLEDGSISKTINIITKQKPNSDCAIEVFLINKNSIEYNNIFKSLKDGFKVIFLNIRDKQKKIYFEDIYNLLSNSKMLSIVCDLDNNKVLQFVIDEDSKDKKEMAKDIYKIITSLTREKINNQDDNVK